MKRGSRGPEAAPAWVRVLAFALLIWAEAGWGWSIRAAIRMAGTMEAEAAQQAASEPEENRSEATSDEDEEEVLDGAGSDLVDTPKKKKKKKKVPGARSAGQICSVAGPGVRADCCATEEEKGSSQRWPGRARTLLTRYSGCQ